MTGRAIAVGAVRAAVHSTGPARPTVHSARRRAAARTDRR